MVAAKVRIYELSKSLGVSNKDIMDHLKQAHGLDIKSHASSIDQDVADEVIAKFSAPKKAAEKPVSKEIKETADKKEQSSKRESQESEARKPAAALEAAQSPSSSPSQPAQSGTARPHPNSGQPGGQASQPQQPKQPGHMGQAHRPQSSQQSHQAPVRPQHSGGGHMGQPQRPQTSQQAQSAQHRSAHQPSRPDGSQAGRPVAASASASPAATATAKTEIPLKAQPKAEPVAVDMQPVRIETPMSVRELAEKFSKRETELIKHLFMKGIMVTVNQTLPIEDALNLARELEIPAEGPDLSEKARLAEMLAPELAIKSTKGKNLIQRAPVVSIMGHVDHGKTSLLDAIRETRHRIVDSEAGGITQRIGAYTVEKDGRKIVFIDTPGHAAFTAMRMRGAQATDIAILVVAADDGVMPQTIEAINHAKAANIPIIVAVNKIDKAAADPDRVLSQLVEHGLNPEKWGGDTITVELSALQKLGIEDLLEMINLVSELLELKADPDIEGEGLVIEARLNKGKGPVATVLVQNGTLKVTDNLLINTVGGRVRALINDYGERVQEAGPSTPVEVLGLSDVPQAGDKFTVIRDDREFKRLLSENQLSERDQRLSTKMAAPGFTSEKEVKDFYLIIKADAQGMVEAVAGAVLQLATAEVSVHILHAGTGDVSESDVMLASANKATIIAFNVKEETNALRMAQDAGVEIRHYDIIYRITEDMEKMMLGMLSPEHEEQEVGVAEVRKIIPVGKKVIAGSYVLEGKIVRNGMARVFRANKEIFKGNLDNLRRFKDDAKEVAAGYECGISFDKFNELQEGDLIRVYQMKEIERTSL